MAHTVDVAGMLDGMTHGQFAEWIAKDMIEPIGTVRIQMTEQQQTEPQPTGDIPGIMSLEAVGWRRS